MARQGPSPTRSIDVVQNEDSRIFPRDVTAELIGVNIRTLERLVAAGAFPKPVRVSPNRLGFLAAEVAELSGSRVGRGQRDAMAQEERPAAVGATDRGAGAQQDGEPRDSTVAPRPTQGRIRAEELKCGEWAVDVYIQRFDFAVLAVDPNTKRPVTANGVKDATKDAEAVARLFEEHPEAGVAVATGEPSGVFVLDLDIGGSGDGKAALAALERRYGTLPVTWRALTPRRGWHLYFRQPQGRPIPNRVGLRVPGFDPSGIDVRGAGGYAILPPSWSWRSRGYYWWLTWPHVTDLADPPAWLLDLIDPPNRPAPPFGPRSSRFAGLAQPSSCYLDAAVDGECRAVATTPVGKRNISLFKAAACLGELVGAGWLQKERVERALRHAARACGLEGDDGAASVNRTIASGLATGIANPRGAGR